MKKIFSETKLGILGGGQLGRMLIQSAIDYNLKIFVLDADSEAPCKDLCTQFECGSLNDYDTVYNWGKTLDIITIEIENVNVDALFALEKEGKSVYPQPEVIRTIQDKRIQKQFFKDNNIPSAEFVLINSRGELNDHISFLPAFQKLGKAGYDGKGVLLLKDPSDFEKGFERPSLLEKKVDFTKEIAVIVARNPKGEIKVFPPVEMVFHKEHNLVDYLLSPSAIDYSIKAKAESIAVSIAEKLNSVGVMAVEMFITHDNEVLVNELAPRPHNSGHHSIRANFTSQYEQHIRAILDLPLGNTDILINSCMINLLGETGYNGIAIYKNIEKILNQDGVFVTLYGKKFTKPFRKMGHVTIMDNDPKSLEEKVKFVKKNIKVIA